MDVKFFLDAMSAVGLPVLILDEERRDQMIPQPLRYLIGFDGCPSAANRYNTEVPFDCDTCADPLSTIAYCNLLDENYSDGQYSYRPYLNQEGTAEEYDEGVIDPNGSGWMRNVNDQLHRRSASGFKILEWDNCDSYATRDVLEVYDYCAQQGFKIVAKNPAICDNMEKLVEHSAVEGMIIERGAGRPASIDRLRKVAGKPALPCWFVFFGRSRTLADAVAHQCDDFDNMWASYSTKGEYASSIAL